MNIDFKSLLCFKRVAELEHLTNAANELFISPAQLSRIISNLENEYGARFFERSSTGFKLNATGKIFYEYVLKFIDISSKAKRAVTDSSLRELANTTIVSNAGLFMSMLVAQFYKQNPNLKIRQLSLTKNKCVRFLKENRADFAIVTPMIDELSLETILVRKEPGCIVYPKGHWLESRTSVSLFELTNEKFIGLVPGCGSRDAADVTFNKVNFHPDYVVETSDSSLILNYVDTGLGISVIPKTSAIQNEKFKFRNVDIDEPIFGLIGLTWLKNREITPHDEIIINIVKDFFDSLPQY